MLVMDMLLSQADGFPRERVWHVSLVGATHAAGAWGSPCPVQADV